jgi:hypothetical protein
MIAFAEAPALPLHKAGPFVAAAYIVFVAVILLYVVIMAVRMGRSERELARLRAEVHDLEHNRARTADAAAAQDDELTVSTQQRQTTPNR